MLWRTLKWITVVIRKISTENIKRELFHQRERCEAWERTVIRLLLLFEKESLPSVFSHKKCFSKIIV